MSRIAEKNTLMLLQWREDSLGCRGDRERLFDSISKLYIGSNLIQLNADLGHPNFYQLDKNAIFYKYYVSSGCSSKDSVEQVENVWMALTYSILDSVVQRYDLEYHDGR